MVTYAHVPLRVARGGLGYAGSHYATIAAHIPSAREVVTAAGHYTAVPRTIPNVRVLERLGFEAPSPIHDEYDWPGPWTPYAHQRATAAFLTANERAFCFSDMGTGKTSAALWAWDYLRRKGLAGNLLILSPLSTVRAVWEREVFRLMPGRGVGVILGSKERRAKLVGHGFEILVMNHDGIKSNADALASRPDITHVIVDECNAYKNSRAELSKALQKFCRGRSVWMMTGTPCSQGPLDAFGLARIVCPERVPPSFTLWRDKVCFTVPTKAGPAFYKPRHGGMDVAFAALQPAIRFEKKDCLDMPPVVHVDRPVATSPEQSRAVKALTDEWVAELDQGAIVAAPTAATRLMKVLQIYQGSVITDGGAVADVDISGRFAALLDLISESKGKVIVFAAFTAAIVRLVRELKAAHYKVARLDGSVSANDRDRIVHEFQNTRNVDIIVAHPKATSHGLTLTAATTTVWWGPIFSVETYLQACARMDRPGQLQDMVIAHLTGGAFEDKAYAAVRGNMVSQQALLDLYVEATKGKLLQ